MISTLNPTDSIIRVRLTTREFDTTDQFLIMVKQSSTTNQIVNRLHPTFT